MKTVYKYHITYDGVLQLPIGAEILTVGMQDDRITMWALIDSDAELEIRVFAVYGTGWQIQEPNVKFISTVFDGAYVWHLFEVFNETL